MLEPKIKLLNIDCLEYMKGLPDKAFSLAITDPPYAASDAINPKSSQNKYKAKRGNYSKVDWNIAPPEEYFTELKRVSCRQIIWGANFFGFVGGYIVWNKNGTAFGEGEMAWYSESMSIKFFEYTWNGMLQGDMQNKESRIHPTQKPVALYKWLLQNYAKTGDKILDTHLGSGSIAIACHDMGFELTGCELDKDYYEAALNRLKIHQQQQTLFEPKQTFEFKQQTLL